jgi:ketosteroid isomerase-like protein
VPVPKSEVKWADYITRRSFHFACAIETADFDGVVTRNDKQINFHGKNLIVWKKQEDGSWKIFRYMFDEIPAKK